MLYAKNRWSRGRDKNSYMKDCKGNELKVGDSVVYVHGKNSSACLATGNVTKIYSNDKERSIDGNAHIYDFRVMKLN